MWPNHKFTKILTNGSVRLDLASGEALCLLLLPPSKAKVGLPCDAKNGSENMELIMDICCLCRAWMSLKKIYKIKFENIMFIKK